MRNHLSMPLLSALCISFMLHAFFLIRIGEDAPQMTPMGAPAQSIAIKLKTPESSPIVSSVEEIILTNAAAALKIPESKKEILEEIAEETPLDQPIAEENVVTSKAEFRSRPTAPVYPDKARRARQEGLVMVRAQVDPQGKTRAVEVSRSSGFPLLDKAALDAVFKWEFMPAKKNNQPIMAWIEVPIHFKLNGG